MGLCGPGLHVLHRNHHYTYFDSETLKALLTSLENACTS
jgi:hypothetical protein